MIINQKEYHKKLENIYTSYDAVQHSLWQTFCNLNNYTVGLNAVKESSDIEVIKEDFKSLVEFIEKETQKLSAMPIDILIKTNEKFSDLIDLIKPEYLGNI